MRHRPIGGLLAVTAVLSLGSVPARADDTVQRKAQVDASVERLRAELAETSEVLAAAVLRLHRARLELGPARSAVASAHGRLVAAQVRDAQLARELAVALAEEKAAAAELAQLEADIARQRAVIAAMATSAYQSGTLGELSVVLGAKTPNDLTDRLTALREVLRSSDGALDRLAGDRAAASARRATLEAHRERTAALKARAARQVLEVRAVEREARAAQARVEELVATAASAAAVVAREKAAEQQRLAQMQAESDRLRGVLVERARAAKARAARAAAAQRAAAQARRSSGSSHSSRKPSSSGRESSSPARSSSGFARPVPFGITSSFGMRTNPVTGVYKLHDGTDFGAPCGSSVRAAASGQVVWAQSRGGYGYQVAVDHGLIGGADVVSTYSHLEQGGLLVSPGERVSRGETIARSGTTGNSTGCHLHFSIYVDGRPMDPMGWL